MKCIKEKEYPNVVIKKIIPINHKAEQDLNHELSNETIETNEVDFEPIFMRTIVTSTPILFSVDNEVNSLSNCNETVDILSI